MSVTLTAGPSAADASAEGALPARAPAFRLEGLRKKFGYREILRGVDLEIAASGCCVLFGPNGAGKSTLLRILATRMRPTAGRLTVLGLDPARDGPRVRASLGIVFHDHFLRGDLTLAENLRFHGELHGLPAAEAKARAEALAAQFGLKARLGDLVRTFSQGMARRATLARSLLHDPKAWILDEPFSGLDPPGCAVLEAVICAKRAEGRAIVLVTHDIEVGLRLSDDCFALADGKVRARGRPAVEEFLGRLQDGLPGPSPPPGERT